MHQEPPLNPLGSGEIPLPESHFRQLGIGSRTTFFRWEKLGLCVLKVGSRRFIRPSELNRFMEAEAHHNREGK